jgi:hypothetical protein
MSKTTQNPQDVLPLTPTVFHILLTLADAARQYVLKHHTYAVRLAQVAELLT